MLFRGLIFTAFREKRGVYVAVLISASIFGFMHITNLLGGAKIGATLIQMLSAGVSGIICAWVFYKTQNIIPAMIFHWIWDMFLLLGMYVPVKQTQILQLGQNLFEQIAGVVLILICIRAIRRKYKKL